MYCHQRNNGDEILNKNNDEVVSSLLLAWLAGAQGEELLGCFGGSVGFGRGKEKEELKREKSELSKRKGDRT